MTFGKRFGYAMRMIFSGASSDDFLRGDDAFLALQTTAGADVSHESVLGIAAFWNGIQLISQTIASLPLNVYKREGELGRKKYHELPLYRVLSRQPHPWINSYQWREVGMHHLLMWGNHYAFIERDRGRRVVGLRPMNPARTKALIENNQLLYEFRDETGTPRYYRRDQVFHVPGLGFDGISGYPVLSIARESLGFALALQEYGNRFFGQGTNVGGQILRPSDAPKLSNDGAERLKTDLKNKFEGLGQSHTVIVLEDGMKFERVDMPLADAEFLASRNFSVQEIARWLNMPPHKLKEQSHATFSNIEHENLSWLIDTVRPWLVRWESAINSQLVPEPMQDWVFAEHNFDALLRADIKTRYEAYATGLQNGIISRNEVRAKENMNPIAVKDGGNVKTVQMNMIDLAKVQEFSEIQVKKNAPAPAAPEAALPEEESPREVDDERNRD